MGPNCLACHGGPGAVAFILGPTWAEFELKKSMGLEPIKVIIIIKNKKSKNNTNNNTNKQKLRNDKKTQTHFKKINNF